MIAGGTGITPMYQALERLVHTPGDTTEVTLLYGNATVADILLKDALAALEEASDGRLKVIHVLGTRRVNPTCLLELWSLASLPMSRYEGVFLEQFI
jgi:NAD(P)H-flavin reductase